MKRGMAKVGVALLNLGGPERIQDVGPFLYNLFADPEIIRLPNPALQKPLAWLISSLRAGKSQAAYRSIGGGSPLRRITEQQASPGCRGAGCRGSPRGPSRSGSTGEAAGRRQSAHH